MTRQQVIRRFMAIGVGRVDTDYENCLNSEGAFTEEYTVHVFAEDGHHLVCASSYESWEEAYREARHKYERICGAVEEVEL